MENTAPNQSIPTQTFRQPLPGSSTVLVLGILSLVLLGLIGLILAVIALSKANEAKIVYELNPDAYELSSYKNMKGGRICAIISISIFSALVAILLLILLISLAM